MCLGCLIHASTVLCVPCLSYVCLDCLESQGIHKTVKVHIRQSRSDVCHTRSTAVERLRYLLAAFRFEVFKFSSFHLYQKWPFKTFYGLYNILKVSKTSKLQLQTRPTFTAIALKSRNSRRANTVLRVTDVVTRTCYVLPKCSPVVTRTQIT